MSNFQETNFRKPFIQVVILATLALLVHAIVLKFIFPGYYSPLYPHHSDFYIAPAMANSPGSFFQYKYLGYSRPLGMFFLKIIGHLGVHGTILFTIINVAVNCSLTALLFRHLLGTLFGWPFIGLFCVYCLVLFCQPYFYTFYTQDLFAHLSYLFLLLGSILFYKFRDRNSVAACAALLTCAVCAFLCKETYALSALFIAFGWLLYYWRRSLRKAIYPLAIITTTLVAVLVFNILIKSVFINLKNTLATNPYYIKTTIPSIYNEMARYAGEGLNVASWLFIATSVFAGFLFVKYNNRSAGYLLAGCIIAAFLSWIPNALIPNHHHGGYSFNGAYLLYLPVFSIPLIVQLRTVYLIPGYALLAFCLVSPFLNAKEYAKQWWILEQESNQRNLLYSLARLMRELQPAGDAQAILITGLTMPFYPFHHPNSLKSYANSKYAVYDVVNYSITVPGQRDDGVKFVRPLDVKVGDYAAVWMFAANGSILKNLAMSPSLQDSITKYNLRELVLYPDSIKNEKLSFFLK
ncbi:MAG: hypothetical protein ABIU63_02245 [Chitinophagaceae bacterium]